VIKRICRQRGKSVMIFLVGYCPRKTWNRPFRSGSRLFVGQAGRGMAERGCGGNPARRAQRVPFGYFQTDTASYNLINN